MEWGGCKMHNYRVEALNDSEIVVYSLYNSRQSSINEFTTVLNHTLTKWNKSRPFLLVIDISYQDTVLNPHTYHQLQNIFANIPQELRGAVAFIMPTNVFYMVAQTYLSNIPNRTSQNIEHSMFKHRDLAIDWLIETSAKYYAAS